MSRFFRQAGDSDSESEESDEELMSSGDEDAPPSRPAAPAGQPAMARFLNRGSDTSDSDSDDSDSDGDDEDADGNEEEGQTIRILSAQEKRLAEMEATGKVMDNAKKINDWVAISNGALKTALQCETPHSSVYYRIR